MKKLTALLIGVCCFSTVFAQTKNGTVYSEHELIEETRHLWKAFENGDQESFIGYFSDSVKVMRNGEFYALTKEEFGNQLIWWTENISDLSVADDKPAYPDAVVYKDGEKWVQDWLMITGSHNASGINLNLRIHNIYGFNDEGKITMLIQYYNNDVFEQIDNSGSIRENGKIYINHPYISTVRKLTNAYASEDLETFMNFYAEGAEFSNTAMSGKESVDKAAREQEVQESFNQIDDIRFKQIGYPDCIYYELHNDYVVYSWWEYSFTVAATGKEVVMPLMLSHTFNADGKITFEIAYFSTNHFEDE